MNQPDPVTPKAQMSDEEFVTGQWLWCEVRLALTCEGYEEGTWLARFSSQRSIAAETESEAWTAAAEFTRGRLEQIRQVEEDIAYLLNIMGRAKETAPDHCVHRVLAREQDALTELKRGMLHE
jgi:hypothetical protein